MHRLSLAMLGLLAACAAPPAPGLRDMTVPIRSIAGFDPAGMTGTWHQTAEIAPGGAAPCAPGGLRVSRAPQGLDIAGRLCLGGVARDIAARAVPDGPGRLRLAGDPDPWWVVWADTDLRTLAIATPSGRFGFVIDRAPATPPDRRRAAAEILGWNGFDAALLR